MRRIIALLTLIALAAMFVVPAVAAAKGGPPAGKGPGFTPPGLAKKAVPSSPATPAPEYVESAEEADAGPTAPGAAAREKAAEKKTEKAAEKAAKAAEKTERKTAREAAKTQVRDGERLGVTAEYAGSLEETGAPDPSDDETGTPDPSDEDTATADPDEPSETGKRHGIANALSRIMANIERAEAKIEAGEKSFVPPGLLRVLAKFMAWLGIEPDPESDPDLDLPGDPGDGSDETTGTPLPGDGSDETTGTPLPGDPGDGSDETTGTPLPGDPGGGSDEETLTVSPAVLE